MSGRLMRTADTVADAYTSVVNMNLDDADLLKVLRPYSYARAECYLGGNLRLQGVLYGVKPGKTGNTRTATLTAASPTVDIVDSTAKPPLEAKKTTLENRIRSLVEPLGIKTVFNISDDEIFKRVTIGPTEKIFDHIAKLASQRAALLSSTILGELLVTRAAAGKPVAVIDEDAAIAQSFIADFNGRNRYNVYIAISQTPGRKRRAKRKSKDQTAKDDLVPKSRMLTFTTDETTAGGMQLAAEWKRSKQLAESLTVSLPVSSWYTPDGALWDENTLVTIKSPTLFVPDGFDFLIRSVEFIFDEKGTRAVLNIVPPQVYTGEQLDEPWAPAELRDRNLIDRVVAAV